MKNYNVNGYKGTHTIRITLMFKDYIGHIAYKVNGNCKGAEILNLDFLESDTQEDIERYVENDCCFKYNEDYDCFSYMLRNPNGDTLECDEEYVEDIEHKVVSIEIIDYKEEEI